MAPLEQFSVCGIETIRRQFAADRMCVWKISSGNAVRIIISQKYFSAPNSDADENISSLYLDYLSIDLKCATWNG